MNKVFTSLNPPEMITEDIKFFNIKFELTLADKDLLGKVEGKNQIWGGKGGSVAWEGGVELFQNLNSKFFPKLGSLGRLLINFYVAISLVT